MYVQSCANPSAPPSTSARVRIAIPVAYWEVEPASEFAVAELELDCPFPPDAESVVRMTPAVTSSTEATCVVLYLIN